MRIKKPKPMNELSRLRQQVSELRERISVEAVHERQKRQLADFLRKRPLLNRRDLAEAAANLPGRRALAGKQAVTSRRASELAETLRAARQAKGMTMIAVGKAAGVSGAAVSHWEAGSTRPSKALRARLSKVLDLPARTFADGEAGSSGPG